jgi:hypothetical protein
MNKKINQYPFIELHSRVPWLDKTAESKTEREDPAMLLHKKVLKEYMREMEKQVKVETFNPQDEVQLYKRFLKMPKKLAYGKDHSK